MGIMKAEGFKKCIFGSKVIDFCWMAVFCLLVELHWEVSAINGASLYIYTTLFLEQLRVHPVCLTYLFNFTFFLIAIKILGHLNKFKTTLWFIFRLTYSVVCLLKALGRAFPCNTWRVLFVPESFLKHSHLLVCSVQTKTILN